MKIPLVPEADFEREVLRSELPVLIDLYADWCAPCKQLEPILEQVGTELQGKLKLIRIDIEKSPTLARTFRVQSIPMLVLIHQGRPVDQRVGLVDKKTILAMVRPVLPREAGEVEPPELAELLVQRAVLPVDIRDRGACERYRIPGAVHIAAQELPSRSADLAPSDGRLRVLYGRSTDDAREASDRLRASGIEVGFLKGGFLHWEADGLEVERGAPE